MKTDTHIVKQLDAAEDTHRRSRLRVMQRIAVGVLLAATALFAVARSHHGQHPAWGYVEAFAEAAMVGAIADWFAVVALFRYPLGIPLWHTAIIPDSKDSIGTSLGNFVETISSPKTASSSASAKPISPFAWVSGYCIRPIRNRSGTPPRVLSGKCCSRPMTTPSAT